MVETGRASATALTALLDQIRCSATGQPTARQDLRRTRRPWTMVPPSRVCTARRSTGRLVPADPRLSPRHRRSAGLVLPDRATTVGAVLLPARRSCEQLGRWQTAGPWVHGRGRHRRFPCLGVGPMRSVPLSMRRVPERAGSQSSDGLPGVPP